MAAPEITPKVAPTRLHRFPLAAAYALRGLSAVWRREAAFGQDTSRADAANKQSRRPELAVETLIVLASVFLVMVTNAAFWQGALAGRSIAEVWTWRFGAATAIALVALNFFAIGLIATRRTVRALLALLIFVSVVGSYFMHAYGIVLDSSMLRNALNTDFREASELMGMSALGAVTLGLLAASLPWAARLRRRTRTRAISVRIGSLGVSIVLAAGALSMAFQDLSSLLRNNRGLRHTITPANIVWGLGQILVDDSRVVGASRASADSARRAIVAVAHRKPTLFVIVVGETARAANFSLNGYPRQTNPQLERLDIINFPHTRSCGTSTEVSLPCLFSPFGRADYDAIRIRNHESLLHLLARAGLRVIWLDNQSGCKGVCNGLEFRDVSRDQVPELCANDHCYDEVLLHNLISIVSGPATDTVVVLHQIGNHGPAYFRRYPPDQKRFEPACENNELRKCTREQIVNAYDNAIAYTDRFLANTIRFLGRERARFDVVLLYVSDHGESLGELGLYLHGMPYAIAPREQLEVPMLWWIPAQSAEALAVDIACLRHKSKQPASHDNVFHSILGLLSVDTPRYKRERDLFSGCREDNVDTAQQLAARESARVP